MEQDIELSEFSIELTQPQFAELYQLEKTTLFGNLVSWVTRITCSHPHHMLVKYELRRSIRPEDRNTVREYQYIRIRPEAQYWKCSYCGKHSTTYSVSEIKTPPPVGYMHGLDGGE